jgi:glycosyltransferase involved in cell wall biosynthesis
MIDPVRPLKIVLLMSSLQAGGSERVAVRVAEWLRDAGHDVSLLTLSDTASDFYQTPTGVTRIGLDLRRPSRGPIDALRNSWRRIAGIRAAVKHAGADVVVAMVDQTNVLMLLALLGLRCRKIISERSDPAAEERSWIWRLLRRLTYPTATLHISQSSHVSKWLRRRFPGLPDMIIGNTAGELPASGAIRAVREDGAPLRLITVARLSQEKGVDLLIDAFAAARERTPDIVLLVVGDGPQRALLERQAEMLGVGASVSFAGRLANVFEPLAASDIFILPSRLEGFPNALVEALMVGLPAISAYCPGGIMDVLGPVPDRYALQFPPGDVAALAAAIVRLADSPALRQELSAAGHLRALDYGPDKISAAWRHAVGGGGAPISGDNPPGQHDAASAQRPDAARRSLED